MIDTTASSQTAGDDGAGALTGTLDTVVIVALVLTSTLALMLICVVFCLLYPDTWQRLRAALGLSVNQELKGRVGLRRENSFPTPLPNATIPEEDGYSNAIESGGARHAPVNGSRGVSGIHTPVNRR